MAATFTLRSKARLAEVRKLAKAVMSILAEDIEDQDELYDLYLALYEAATNVVRHAYAAGEAGDIELDITVAPGQSVELKIMDWGSGFPCDAASCKPMETRKDSGRGLMIMSGLSHEFNVTRLGTKNIVTMKRHIQDKSWKICA